MQHSKKGEQPYTNNAMHVMRKGNAHVDVMHILTLTHIPYWLVLYICLLYIYYDARFWLYSCVMKRAHVCSKGSTHLRHAPSDIIPFVEAISTQHISNHLTSRRSWSQCMKATSQEKGCLIHIWETHDHGALMYYKTREHENHL